VTRSVWWRAGWPDSARWTSREEVAQGWLVVVATRALDALEEGCGEPLNLSWEVERDFLSVASPIVRSPAPAISTRVARLRALDSRLRASTASGFMPTTRDVGAANACGGRELVATQGHLSSLDAAALGG
jgi:hypothetical protein